MIAENDTLPDEQQHRDQAQSHRDFVRDHLGARAQAAEQAYLLFDDQPASAIPYTPSELIARTKRNPIGRSATDHRHQAVMDELARAAAG